MESLMGKENLIQSNGVVWKIKRKLSNTIFNYDFIVAQIPKIEQICTQTFEKIEQQFSQSSDPSTVKLDITDLLNGVFSNVILKCFFKADQLNQVGKEKTGTFVNRLLKDIIEEGRSKIGAILGSNIKKIGLTSQSRKIRKQIEQFRRIATEIVEKRIKDIKQSKTQMSECNSNPEDIIGAYIKYSQKQQGKVSPGDIVNEFVTFFLAGTQTTVAFTRMMIYRLASYPEIMEKVREEISREIKSEHVTMEELKNLKYVEEVQKEVLRMDSSVGAIITRVAMKDHYLKELAIKNGTAINLRIRGIHYKESLYPSPHKFMPERWDDDNKQHPYAYLPFSSGSRNCIGQHLALLENKILLVKLLKRYSSISINKNVSEIRMLLRTMYGPEQLQTTLKKFGTR